MYTSVSERQTYLANDKSSVRFMEPVMLTRQGPAILYVRENCLRLFFFASEELAAGSHLCLNCHPAPPHTLTPLLEETLNTVISGPRSPLQPAWV